MGLQTQTLALHAPLDPIALERTLREQTGVRARVRGADDVYRVSSWRLAATVDVWSTGGSVTWEAPHEANPYLVAHVHAALLDLSGEPLAPRVGLASVRWTSLPIRQRVTWGWPGVIARVSVMLLAAPLAIAALALANVLAIALGRERVQRAVVALTRRL